MMAWNLSEGTSARDLTSRRLLSTNPVETRPPFDILHKLKEFRDDKRFCDIEVNVQGKIFPIHKAVFAAWSPVFAAQVPDTVKSHGVREEVLISFGNSQVFEDFLNFLYMGSMVLTGSNVEELLHLAVNFKVEALMAACEEFLRYNIHIENYLTLYFLCQKFNLKALEDIIIHYVIGNMQEVTKHGELFSLSASKFLSFLSSGKMEEMKREIKFALIVAWVSASIEERENYVLFLLNQIDWTAPVDDLLLDISCTENIFSASEFCMFQLLQTLVSQGHPVGHFASVFPRLSQMYNCMLGDILKSDLIQPVVEELVAPIPLFFRSRVETAKKCSDGQDVSRSLSVQKKDVSVNTDVDSSYFAESLPVLQKKSHTVSVSSQGQKLCQESSETMDSKTASECKATEDNQREETADKEPDRPPVVLTIRRKRGRPRKVPDISGQAMEVKATKDAVAKRKVGRARKKSEEGTFEVKVESVSDDEELDQLTEMSEDIENGNEPDDQSASSWEEEDTVSSRKAKSLNRKKTIKRDKRKVPGKKTSLHGAFKCNFESCDYATKFQDRLEKHIEKLHKSNLKLKCRHCDYQTPLMRNLCFHLKVHYQGPPFACNLPDCTFQSMSMRLLVCHFMEHDGEKPYQCDICNKSFHLVNRLNNHRKLHQGRQFTCDICNKTFTTKGIMMTHRAIHFDQRPYLCDTCGFTTKHQSHLISHRKIHTGQVLHCQFPACNYTTPKQGHMTQHMNGHLNIRDHICQVCGKSFVVRSKLLRHELIHLDQKLFKCTSCDYQTSRRDRMKLHIASHGREFQQDSYVKL